MQNTDGQQLSALVELLRGQRLRLHEILEQITLLAAWAWCSQNRPELSLPSPQDRPGIPAAMAAIEKALSSMGAELPQRDALEMNCTGRVLQELQEQVAELAWPTGEALVAEIGMLGRDMRADLLSPDLSKIMLKQAKAVGQKVLFAYEMSAVPMAFADGATSRVYASQSVTPLTAGLVLVAGATVIAGNPEVARPDADVVVAAPAFGLKATWRKDTETPKLSSEGAGLQFAWERSSSRAVVLVTPGVLSRRGSSEDALRTSLVRANAIEMVIQLPSQTLANTILPPVLVVLDHSRDEKKPIVFVDAERVLPQQSGARRSGLPSHPEFWGALNALLDAPDQGAACTLATRADIESNDFDLSVNRYVIGDASRKIHALDDARPLADVAEIIRGQLIKGEDGDDSDDSAVMIEIGGRDIDESGQIRLQEPRKALEVSGRSRRRAEQLRVRPGDVLLIGKGSTGRIAIVGEDCGQNWVAGQVFLIIRSQDRGLVRPEYLYRYLASPLVQQYLEEIASGSGIPILKAQDIKSLPVPVPGRNEQERVIDVHRQIMTEYEAIDAHRAKIDDLARVCWSI